MNLVSAFYYLLFQVFLNAYIEANGCDGQYFGGDGGVVSVTQGDRGKIKVNPGKGRGVSHGNMNGKKGIIIGKCMLKSLLTIKTLKRLIAVMHGR